MTKPIPEGYPRVTPYLIVDGAAETQPRDDSTVVVIRPSRPVLHRVADAGGDGPSCVTVL